MGNRLTQVHLKNGRLNGVCVCLLRSIVFLCLCVFSRFEVAYFIGNHLSLSTGAYGDDSSA